MYVGGGGEEQEEVEENSPVRKNESSTPSGRVAQKGTEVVDFMRGIRMDNIYNFGFFGVLKVTNGFYHHRWPNCKKRLCQKHVIEPLLAWDVAPSVTLFEV